MTIRVGTKLIASDYLYRVQRSSFGFDFQSVQILCTYVALADWQQHVSFERGDYHDEDAITGIIMVQLSSLVHLVCSGFFNCIVNEDNLFTFSSFCKKPLL